MQLTLGFAKRHQCSWAFNWLNAIFVGLQGEKKKMRILRLVDAIANGVIDTVWEPKQQRTFRGLVKPMRESDFQRWQWLTGVVVHS
jgi:hypothetical protein